MKASNMPMTKKVEELLAWITFNYQILLEELDIAIFLTYIESTLATSHLLINRTQR